MNDNVKQFPGTEPLPVNPITLEVPPFGHCAHDLITLDGHNRTVRCTTCSKVLDPFNFLKDNALTLQTAWRNYRMVMESVRQKNELLEVLKKEEARLKGLIRRHKEKVEPPIDTRGRHL
ncbi:hypothetical protein [Rhodoferax koreensis]|uniref:hypothetical protein n=1 Tax=Rhodoferax koreensis TaxID=1842727 RepID=UPI0009F85E0C|nr:hypothetical protein [Rhodoferax koreense]